MRDDMAKIIVERPRHYWGKSSRKGRNRPLDDLPTHQGMRRPWRESGNWKELNENLQPLRRYLERQVGRPWDKIYSEIAARLLVDSAVQQHVRDHVWDFVAIRSHRWPPNAWYRTLYVDPNDGILKRLKMRQKSRQQRSESKPERVRLSEDRELRLIKGLWYEIHLASLPEPVYRAFVEQRKIPLKAYHRTSPTVNVTMIVRRLATSAVRDVVTGAAILSGPEIDDERSWKEYRLHHSDRRYAVAKRTLSCVELRRHGLHNDVPAD